MRAFLAAFLAAAVGCTGALAEEVPKKTKQKPSASAGRSAPPGPKFEPDPVYDAAFRSADMDGDGMVSKAEAAGDEKLVLGFFRADRNRDGKLNRREYEALHKPRQKAGARASAGASRPSR